MTKKSPSTGAFCAVVVSALAFVPSSYSQAVDPSQPASADKPVPKQPIPTENESDKSATEEILVLSPFEVNTSQDRGYQATNTLAGSRINTKLKDVGSAIQVVTPAFLRDTNATNSTDLLVMTTGTEVGNIGGNFLGAGNGSVIGTQAQRGQPQNNTRVRGLTSADNTRDYYITDIAWDSYNTERIEIQRGANAILFGNGSPAGIINNTTRSAEFKDLGDVQFRYGSYGSIRTSLDVNHVLIKDELAFRVDGLHDNEVYQQNPAHNNTSRVYLAGRYDPKLLNNDVVRTSIKVNIESGRTHANNPDSTPPIDAITPWFTDLNKGTYNAALAWTTNAAQLSDPALASQHPGALVVGSKYSSPWVANMGRIYDNLAFVYPNPKSGATSGGLAASNAALMAPNQAIAGLTGGGLMGIRTYDVYANYAQLPGYGLGVYKAKSLTDTSIFDFRNNLLAGPNDFQNEDWHAFNLELTQSYFDNRLAFSGSFDQQHYNQKQEYLSQGFANAISVDINSFLVDGTPNPNVGRPVIATDSGNNSSRETWRDSFRFTATGDLRSSDFFDKSSLIARILGHHSFTGLYSQENYEARLLSWARYATDDVYGNLIQTTATTSPNRQIATISYLGASLLNASSASGAHLSAITAIQLPETASVRVFNSSSGLLPDGTNATSHWENRSVTIWNADNGDIDKLYTSASKTMVKDTAKAIIWQGYMFDETFVPMAGLRKDYSKYYTAGSAPATTYGSVNAFSSNWEIGSDPTNTVEGTTKTWGAVLHTPQFIKKYLPWGTDLSLNYNRSQNFNPQPDRIDIYGKHLASPEGKTKDYGFTISTLNDRIILKVNWYESRVSNASMSGGIPGNFYMIGDAEAWGYMYAKQAQARTSGFATDYAPAPGQSQAAATAEENLAVSTFLSHLQSDEFWKAWGISGGGAQLTPSIADANKAWTGWIAATTPSNLAITGDTLSKGTEYELTARPYDNWDITLNASKTHATQLNLAKSVSDWIEAEHTFFDGPAGNVRLWNNGYSPTETLRQKFNNNAYSAYLLLKLQEGTDVPELRPWHVNIVSTYHFDKTLFGGKLNGLRVGGAYRWQDKEIIGYGLNGSLTDPLNPPTAVDISKVYYGPALTNIDLWLGYEFKLSKKLTWDIQFNVKNLFAKKDLIPVSAEPNGTIAQYRIPESTVYSINNTLKF